MILSHRDLSAVVQLEADPLGYALEERRRAVHRDSPIVSEPEHGDGLPACGEFGYGCLLAGQWVEDPCPWGNAAPASQKYPSRPVAGRRDLVWEWCPAGFELGAEEGGGACRYCCPVVGAHGRIVGRAGAFGFRWSVAGVASVGSAGGVPPVMDPRPATNR